MTVCGPYPIWTARHRDWRVPETTKIVKNITKGILPHCAGAPLGWEESRSAAPGTNCENNHNMPLAGAHVHRGQVPPVLSSVIEHDSGPGLVYNREGVRYQLARDIKMKRSI